MELCHLMNVDMTPTFICHVTRLQQAFPVTRKSRISTVYSITSYLKPLHKSRQLQMTSQRDFNSKLKEGVAALLIFKCIPLMEPILLWN